MKSFIAYPLELEPQVQSKNENTSGKLIAHYELFKQAIHLDGAVVKCGIIDSEGFSRFTMFKQLSGATTTHKMVAFQRYQPLFEEVVTKDGDITLKVLETGKIQISRISKKLLEKEISQSIDFVPGSVIDSIPQYLIENPELKIAFLNIDLDDYESTLTTLEFFYPRLMPGGILVMDNYHKGGTEKKAISDYFCMAKMDINNFSVNNGPYYIVKP